MNKPTDLEVNKKLDLRQRRKDGWMDVELFRIVKDRLPSDEDDLTKSIAKEYIDRFIFGSEDYTPASVQRESMDKFAFHVFASTNLAYTNDLEENYETNRLRS